MGKTLRTVLLCGALSVLLCMSVWAAGTAADSGIKDLTVTNNKVAVEPCDQTGDAVTKETDYTGMDSFYPLAEKVNVTYSEAQAGKFYAVFLISGENALPTESNLKYIDQVQAGDSGAAFTVYPNELTAGETYHICISGNADSGIGKLAEVASFSYYEPPKLALGDVTGEGAVNAADAAYILQKAAGADIFDADQKIAADVDKNGTINAVDATYVLQYAVGSLKDFALVQ